MGKFTEQKQNWLFASEGGYVDHPRDPGGATNHGVTHKTLAGFRGVPSVSKNEVKALTKAEAAKIMKLNYWDKISGDQLPEGLDYAAWDYAVNSGVSRAVKDLQRVVKEFYKGSVDGISGSQTLTAIKEYIEVYGLIQLITEYCEKRYNFVKSLSTFATFGKGWTRRIMGGEVGFQKNDIGVIDRSILLAQGYEPDVIPGPIPSAEPTDHGKATPEKSNPIDTLTKDPSAWSGIAAVITAILSGIINQPILQFGVVILIIILLWKFVIQKNKVDPA